MSSSPARPPAGGPRPYSEATKQALVEVAEGLFAEQGYAATSLDAIVAGAQVTKGALYHHFSGKQALFEAVFVQVESSASAQVQKVLIDHDDPWERAAAGLAAFLEVVRQPAYQRIVVQEGPAVLGYERFREQEELATFGQVREIVRAALAAGDRPLDEPMGETFSTIFFGAMSSTGAAVATSDDPEAETARVIAAIGLVLAGLREQMASGHAATWPS